MISYQKGVEVAERYLGGTHPITSTLLISLKAAKKAAALAAKKAIMRKGGDSITLPKVPGASDRRESNHGNASNRLYQIY